LTIEAVSLSAPSRDAAEVMAACGVTTAYPKRLAADEVENPEMPNRPSLSLPPPLP
jgi:hypothetical protein